MCASIIPKHGRCLVLNDCKMMDIDALSVELLLLRLIISSRYRHQKDGTNGWTMTTRSHCVCIVIMRSISDSSKGSDLNNIHSRTFYCLVLFIFDSYFRTTVNVFGGLRMIRGLGVVKILCIFLGITIQGDFCVEKTP